MRNSENRTQGFDFGTSPHGLSADSSRADQETRGTGGLHSLEDGFAGCVACDTASEERTASETSSRQAESQTQDGAPAGTRTHRPAAELDRGSDIQEAKRRGLLGINVVQIAATLNLIRLAWWLGLFTDPEAPDSYRGPVGRLWLVATPAAAWWYENVISYSAAVAYDPIWHTVDKVAPGRGQQLAGFLSVSVIPKLLGEWPVWPIARPYLQAKWALENEELDRREECWKGGSHG